jgi:PAS domain S-box-containing protein
MRTRVAHAKAEEAVRQSEARLATFAAATFEGIVHSREGRIVDCNEQFARMMGYRVAELLGRKIADLMAPEDRDRVMVNIRHGLPSQIEHAMIRKDGTRVIVEAHGRPDPDGPRGNRMTVLRDITERKQAEESLREAKEFSDALNQINEVISSNVDREEIMRAVITKAGKAIGCETAAISLRKDDHWEVSYVFGLPQDLIGTEMLDEQEPHAVLALETRKPVAIDDAYNDVRVSREHMKKYGIRSVLVVPLFLENEPLGVIFFNYHTLSKPFTDAQIDFAAKVGAVLSLGIEKVRLMNALKLRAAELEVANKELDAFSYTVSHDLKNPLRSIQGFAQAITDDYNDRLDDEGKDFLSRITSAGERMTQLIDALFEISRLTDRNLFEKSVDLSALADSIVYELKKKEPDRQVEFVIGKGIKVRGDTDMLEIVLRNLLDNSWKFTSKHASAKIEFGTIECATPLDGEGDGGGKFAIPRSEPRIPDSEFRKTVYFVRDDGAGFNMEFADKLFMPFKRLHSAAEFPGLGIGLATARKIINKHGGKIWAEGEPKKGATFYFTLK